MKLLALFVGLASIGQAQVLPRVDPPAAVDVNVTSVEWHPRGIALSYTKEEKNGGRGVGLYAVGQKEGNIVLHLGPGDHYQTEWFNGQPLAAMVVYHAVQRGDVPSVEASIYMGDATAGTASKLWSEVFPADKGVRVDVNTSPLLKHAIFRVTTGKNRYHLALLSGGNRMVYARDLDQAVQEGVSGPTWSIDGSAVYTPTGIPAKPGLPMAIVQDSSAGNNNTFNLHLNTTERLPLATYQVSFDEIKLSGLKFTLTPPAPPAGAAVLELMPANAVMRQIRFRGSWKENVAPHEVLYLTTRDTNVQFNNSSFIAKSLWLACEKVKDNPFLLAAHADQSWIAPRNAGVAYTTDGALFVRNFNSDRR